MDRDFRTVYCGNLSNKITEDVLYELFLQAGPIEEVKIPKDRESRPRGFGFVTFKHIESVDYALKLFKGTKLYYKELTTDYKVQLPQEQPMLQHPEMLMPMVNGHGMGSGMMPPMIPQHGPNMYPNLYGSHTQLGYQGPANMYPSRDRRNSSRSKSYRRH